MKSAINATGLSAKISFCYGSVLLERRHDAVFTATKRPDVAWSEYQRSQCWCWVCFSR